MKTYVQRYFWFVIGIIINSFGVALITKAGLGTSPISSVSYVLSLQFPFTLGQFTFIVNMIFIFVQFILLKKDFEPIEFFQIAVNLIFSAYIDISMNLLSWISINNFIVELFTFRCHISFYSYYFIFFIFWKIKWFRFGYYYICNNCRIYCEFT